MSGAAIVQKGLQELNDQHDTGVSESRGVGDKKWWWFRLLRGVEIKYQGDQEGGWREIMPSE